MYSYNKENLLKYFNAILQRSIHPDAWTWLIEKTTQITRNNSQMLFIAFTSAPRHTGKTSLSLTKDERQHITDVLPGFNLSGYTADRLARIILLLHWPAQDKENYVKNMRQLFKAAEMNELVALYGALPLLAYPEEWINQCTEGIRSNIGSVLEAIMCDNVFPAQFLPETAWNQMVLKAFFTEKPVDRIVDLDKRANKALAYTLSDYAHERWAAHRTVNPQLWRLTAKFIDERIYPDIYKVFQEGTETEKKAAALACAQSDYGPAKELLNKMPAVKKAIEKNEFSWDSLGHGEPVEP
jgi:hypothetical protein